ncbi:MAG: hypothetical protein ACKPKO_26740, partial [Candidatus Fonsibacter sp.]
FPNGILPWRGGVFVTCAPDILYLKDHDGDGVAEERTVVLTGFSTSRTTQIRTSHPTLGLDGWVYVTSGLNGGKVRSPRHPERPEVNYAPADARFHPETLEFQVVGTRAFRLNADKRADLAFGTLHNDPDDVVATVPAGSRGIVFANFETGRVISPIDLTVMADFQPAELYVRNKASEVRLALQAMNAPCWNFMITTSKHFLLNRKTGTLRSSVET